MSKKPIPSRNLSQVVKGIICPKIHGLRFRQQAIISLPQKPPRVASEALCNLAGHHWSRRQPRDRSGASNSASLSQLNAKGQSVEFQGEANILFSFMWKRRILWRYESIEKRAGGSAVGHAPVWLLGSVPVGNSGRAVLGRFAARPYGLFQ